MVDLYRLRRVLEVDVVRGLMDRDPELPASRLEPLQDDVEAAEAAALAARWPAVGTADRSAPVPAGLRARHPRGVPFALIWNWSDKGLRGPART